MSESGVEDHEEALARLEAAEGETARLIENNAALALELDAARSSLGGARKRMMWFALFFAAALGLGAGGFALGRSSVPPPQPASPATVPAAPAASVFGLIVADGPELGNFVLRPTHCNPQPDRSIELPGDTDPQHTLWVMHSSVQIEMPSSVLILDQLKCYKRLDWGVDHTDDTPPEWSGWIDLQCSYGGNHLVGRVEFRHCKAAR